MTDSQMPTYTHVSGKQCIYHPSVGYVEAKGFAGCRLDHRVWNAVMAGYQDWSGEESADEDRRIRQSSPVPPKMSLGPGSIIEMANDLLGYDLEVPDGKLDPVGEQMKKAAEDSRAWNIHPLVYQLMHVLARAELSDQSKSLELIKVNIGPVTVYFTSAKDVKSFIVETLGKAETAEEAYAEIEVTRAFGELTDGHKVETLVDLEFMIDLESAEQD